MKAVAPPAEKDEQGRILCEACKEPIHIDDIGGVGRAKSGKEVWFHNALPCILAISTILTEEHATEARRMGKELKNGTPTTTNEKLTEYKPNFKTGSYEF